MRKTVTATDPGQTFGMPTDRSSAQELERGLGVLAGREDRVALYRRIAAQAGLSGVRPAAACLLTRIAAEPGVTRADLAEQIGTSTANLAPSLDQLASRELVTIEPSIHALHLTGTADPLSSGCAVRARTASASCSTTGRPSKKPSSTSASRRSPATASNGTRPDCATTKACAKRPDAPTPVLEASHMERHVP